MYTKEAHDARDGRMYQQLMAQMEGVQFPAQKPDLLHYAEAHGLPDELVQILHYLPLERYDSAEDLAQGLRRIL